MATHMWAENPRGKWTLTVQLDPKLSDKDDVAVLSEWTLMVHGTLLPPYAQQVGLKGEHQKLELVSREHRRWTLA